MLDPMFLGGGLRKRAKGTMLFLKRVWGPVKTRLQKWGFRNRAGFGRGFQRGFHVAGSFYNQISVLQLPGSLVMSCLHRAF